MVDQPARFAWYELLTTDVAAASAFYGKVVGWGAKDASTPGLAYTLLTAGDVPVGGLMDLPEEGRRLAEGGRSLVEQKFSEQQFFQRVKSLYSSLSRQLNLMGESPACIST